MVHTVTFVTRNVKVYDNVNAFPVAVGHKITHSNESGTRHVKALDEMCSPNDKFIFTAKTAKDT